VDELPEAFGMNRGKRNALRVWWGNLKKGFHMKVLATSEGIILKWILKECIRR